MQNTLEEAIIQINKFIAEINITNQMITPLIADTVFTIKKRIPKQEILLKTPRWASPRGGSMHQMGRANSTKNQCQLLCIYERYHSPAASNMQNKKKETPEEDHSPSRPRKREWKTYWGELGMTSPKQTGQRVSDLIHIKYIL